MTDVDPRATAVAGSTDPRVAAVKEQLEAGTPPAWLWDEHGRQVIGEVVGGFLGNTKFATGIPVVTLKILEGPNKDILVSVWGTGVLGDRLRRLNLAIGDVVGIERGETKEMSAGGNEYWNYNVARYGTGSNALGWDDPTALPEPVEVPPAIAETIDATPTDYDDPGFYKGDMEEGGF